jgi:very-short-patch-repair endonuclease
VISHESAAILWGLPTLTVPDRTHLIQRSWPAGERAPDVARHSHRLGAGETTSHRGAHVTTLERTAVDCAMSLGALAGLVVADACLHNGARRDLCLDTIAAMAGRRGAPKARAILALADDGAESPGETRTRFALLRAGLPAPVTQVQVTTALGVFWSDLGWPQWRLLVEYDGRSKYDSAEHASVVVGRERRRQRAVEEAGWRIVRVTTEDLRQPSSLVSRVARHLPPSVLDGLTVRRSLRTAG